jgi:hypothetical protein
VAVYFEAAAVITVLVLLGQVRELKAREQTSGAIKALLSLAPTRARRIKEDGSDEEVDLEQLKVGDSFSDLKTSLVCKSGHLRLPILIAYTYVRTQSHGSMAAGRFQRSEDLHRTIDTAALIANGMSSVQRAGLGAARLRSFRRRVRVRPNLRAPSH